MAQTRDISGTITDKTDGSGIPGVNIAVKGTSVGTVTDSNGKFALKAPSSANTLVVSYIGFATQEVAIADNVEISLEPSAEQLNEVVVSVGRGSQRTVTETPLPIDIFSQKDLTSTGQQLLTKHCNTGCHLSIPLIRP